MSRAIYYRRKKAVTIVSRRAENERDELMANDSIAYEEETGSDWNENVFNSNERIDLDEVKGLI